MQDLLKLVNSPYPYNECVEWWGYRISKDQKDDDHRRYCGWISERWHRTYGQNVILELYRDELHKILDMKLDQYGIGVKINLSNLQYDTYTPDKLSAILDNLYKNLQFLAKKAESRIIHCSTHYKDKQSAHELSPKQRQIVSHLWDLQLNRYKLGLPRLNKSELKELMIRFANDQTI